MRPSAITTISLALAEFRGHDRGRHIGIVLASLGFLNPLLAAFIHVASEMAFILNSARLLPGAERTAKPAITANTANAIRVM